MVRGPIGVTLAPYHLSYGVRLTDGLLIVVLYVVAVCRRLTPLVDIRAITAYCGGIAPDPGSCTLEIQGAVQDRSFLIRVGAVKALRPSKGQEPAGANFSHRDLSRRTGYPVRHIPY
jgi:hypothetical protein